MASIKLKEEETKKRTNLETKEKGIKNGRNNQQLQILSRGQDLIHPLSTLFIRRNGRKQQKYNIKFS